MLDDVADVAPVAKPVSISPDKAALRYLEASGARAISVTTGNGHVVINVGFKPDAVATVWLPADKARWVAARARAIAGDNPDVESAVAALREVAVHCRTTLTPHDIAVARAASAARRLDDYFTKLRECGAMREFSRAYKRRRLAAAARGENFMKFTVAELRLKRALIPLLQNGGQPAIGTSLFATIFGD